jgi:predicted metal-dependent enzyme (double-stranded beta helix superfamily)
MPDAPLDRLVASLRRCDWSDPALGHRDAQRVLASIKDPRPLLAAVREVDPQRTEQDGSAEKTTHFKWFLGADPDQRFELWLNEYKPKALRRPGHAEVAHNHRFWFTSLVLAGGFQNAVYLPAGDETLQEAGVISLSAGDTFVVDPDAIHSLRALADSTVTLIVQSQPVRSFSDVYENGRKVRYYDLPGARREFNDRLAGLAPFSPARHHH